MRCYFLFRLSIGPAGLNITIQKDQTVTSASVLHSQRSSTNKVVNTPSFVHVCMERERTSEAQRTAYTAVVLRGQWYDMYVYFDCQHSMHTE